MHHHGSRSCAKLNTYKRGLECRYPPCCIRAFARRDRHNQPTLNVWLDRWMKHRHRHGGYWRSAMMIIIDSHVPCRPCQRRKRARWAVVFSHEAEWWAEAQAEYPEADADEPVPLKEIARRWVTRPWKLKWPWRQRVPPCPLGRLARLK